MSALPHSPRKGRCEKIRQGEAPAEPHSRKILSRKGSAGASPSRDTISANVSQLQADEAAREGRSATARILSLESFSCHAPQAQE